MAALLCQSLCKLLGDCTSCVAYPCRACCECAGKMLCSPFVPYLAVTLAFNVPLVLWGYETVKQNASDCSKVWWLWVNACMAIGHIIGSMYIVYRIQRSQLNPFRSKPYEEYDDFESGGGSHQKPPMIATVLPKNRHRMNQQYPDDASSVPYDVGSKSDDDNSRKPLYKKSIVPAVDSDDAMKYQNLDQPEVRAHPVNSPRSVHSSSAAATGSPFRDLFSSNHKNSELGGGRRNNNNNNNAAVGRESNDGKIESVASMIAGISESPDDGPSNSFHRLGHVLCYDPGVALYFFVAMLWVIWQSVGVTVAISLAGNMDGDDYDGDQCANIKGWIVLSTMCGFLYMMLVFFAFGCSLLCLR
jgi:hypothetical protein